MRLSILFSLLLVSYLTFACEGGYDVRYCDSSTGLNVNQNGDYGSSYCTRHAVMDMQKFAGKCIWHGGVAKITEKQEIMCNDGTLSEMSTLQTRKYNVEVGFVQP